MWFFEKGLFTRYSVQQIVAYYTIRVGATLRNDGAQYGLSNIIYHPGFTTDVYQYDVGLLKLNRKLEFGVTVQPIKLADPQLELEYGQFLVVSGWGRLWVCYIRSTGI